MGAIKYRRCEEIPSCSGAPFCIELPLVTFYTREKLGQVLTFIESRWPRWIIQHLCSPCGSQLLNAKLWQLLCCPTGFESTRGAPVANSWAGIRENSKRKEKIEGWRLQKCGGEDRRRFCSGVGVCMPRAAGLAQDILYLCPGHRHLYSSQ